jgi:hypothetical protein
MKFINLLDLLFNFLHFLNLPTSIYLYLYICLISKLPLPNLSIIYLQSIYLQSINVENLYLCYVSLRSFSRSFLYIHSLPTNSWYNSDLKKKKKK